MRAGLGEGDGGVDDFSGFGGRAALGDVAALLRGTLRQEADVAQVRCRRRPGPEPWGVADIHLKLDGIGAGLAHKAGGIGDGGGDVRVGGEGHVRHDEGLGRAAADGGGEDEQKVQVATTVLSAPRRVVAAESPTRGCRCRRRRGVGVGSRSGEDGDGIAAFFHVAKGLQVMRAAGWGDGEAVGDGRRVWSWGIVTWGRGKQNRARAGCGRGGGGGYKPRPPIWDTKPVLIRYLVALGARPRCNPWCRG